MYLVGTELLEDSPLSGLRVVLQGQTVRIDSLTEHLLWRQRSRLTTQLHSWLHLCCASEPLLTSEFQFSSVVTQRAHRNVCGRVAVRIKQCGVVLDSL